MASDSTVAHYLEDDGEPLDLTLEERRELEFLRAVMHDQALWDDPPASLEEHVVAAILGERHASGPLDATDRVAAGGQVAEAPMPALSRSAASPNVVTIGSRRLRGAGRPPSRWANFAAGLAVAAVIAGGVLIVKHFPTTTAGTTSAVRGEGSLATATGKVTAFTTTSGVRLELDASGLPRLDNDDFYEAWLRSSDGTKLVPVGTFHTGATVTLWAGVSLTDYPTFTVTREHAAGPTDAAQGSSGDVVLKGELRS